MVKLTKRGEEYVEASLVLPILILTILSMIFVCIYYYESLIDSVTMHGKLINYTLEKNYVLNIKYETKETSKEIKGLFNSSKEKRHKGRIYVINEANIIRGGEMVDFDQ